MNSIKATILGIALSTCAYAKELPIIPKPLKTEIKNTSFTLTKGTAIRYDSKLAKEASFLASALQKVTGVKPKLIKEGRRIKLRSEIYLDLAKNKMPKEGYKLKVNTHKINILGNDSAGAFYGVQSLLQIINPDKTISGCVIIDQPRFGWRGMHLDVGRHMFAPKDIKKFIDWLAIHKLNTFHWHLTEDQGWRIEIKKYPKLTSVGGFRASTAPYGNRKGSDGKRYGGFYTQEQIKDIVAYAQARHITIVPEIDMPGHMAAAIAAYPQLGNDDIKDYKPTVGTRWGVLPYILSPKEETFQWVDDVLTEVCALFPSTYIHIGGDEAPKGQWKQSKFAQSVMKREKLHNEHDLQSYFIKRVEKILEAKGRKLIGWDEIREGGLSPKASVMSWRGMNGGIASAKEGHDVIMAPTSHTYFDFYQYTPSAILAQGSEFEAIGGHLPINKVYSFDPVPKQLKGTQFEKHILGCQAQLWTEYMKTWDKVEYRAFPRIAALSEVAWTALDRKNYADFMTRLKPMMERYKADGINYFDVFNPPGTKPKKLPKGKDGLKVTTSMTTYLYHSPVFAIDGNLRSRFWSNREAKKDDYFAVTLAKPLQEKMKMQVFTGASDAGADHLKSGIIQARAGNGEWKQIAAFSKGNAIGLLPKGSTEARILVTNNQNSWLVIREINLLK